MKHLTNEELAIYVDALESNSLENIDESIIKHVLECDHCAKDAIELNHILFSKKPQTEKTRIRKNAIYYLSAAVAASLILFMILFNTDTFNQKHKKLSADNLTEDSLIKKGMDTMGVISKKDEKKKKEKKSTDTTLSKETKKHNQPTVLLAEAYVSNSNLEKLVNRFKGNVRGDIVEILTPSEFEIQKQEKIILRWLNEYQEEIFIEVFNNNGEKIYNTTSVSDSVIIEKTLDNGLYYWKIFNTEFDLLFTGKIIIKEQL